LKISWRPQHARGVQAGLVSQGGFECTKGVILIGFNWGHIPYFYEQANKYFEYFSEKEISTSILKDYLSIKKRGF